VVAVKEPHSKALASLPVPPERDLAGALHEVSNALTVVLGWLDNALEACAPESGSSMDGTARQAIEVARSHASLGHAIARRAVGAPVTEGGELRSALTLVQDTVTGVMPIADRRGISIDIDDDVADVLLPDAPFVQQILINLLLNALAYTPSGETIRLTLRNERSRFVFRVRDDGPGVPEDQRDRIFKAGPSRRPGGAGIGLAHSHDLAQSRGGTLTLLDGGTGACFELRWPVGDAPSTTLSRTTTFKMLDGLRVAVLEDDPAVMSLLEFGLCSRGVELYPLSSRAQLEDFAKLSTKVDIALIDLSPIQTDPDSAIAALRRQSPNVTIFLISGTAAAHTASPGGIAGWIRKPFELSEIFQALSQARRL
jgi:CheY-like chemotaxis protein/two-component sensor histidine kinase